MVYRPVRSCLRAQEMEYSGQSMAWQDTRNVLFQFPEEVLPRDNSLGHEGIDMVHRRRRNKSSVCLLQAPASMAWCSRSISGVVQFQSYAPPGAVNRCIDIANTGR